MHDDHNHDNHDNRVLPIPDDGDDIAEFRRTLLDKIVDSMRLPMAAIAAHYAMKARESAAEPPRIDATWYRPPVEYLEPIDDRSVDCGLWDGDIADIRDGGGPA